MKAKLVRGRLSDNPELVQRAMARAKDMADLEPGKRQVNGEHWVFVFPRGPASRRVDEQPATAVKRSPCSGDRSGKKHAPLPIFGQGDPAEGAAKKLCPSFGPRKPGIGWIFGVVDGNSDHPEMIPLERPEPVTDEVFEMVAPFHPSEVFRITAPCVEGNCKNFGEGACHLAKSAVKTRRVTNRLQPCPIRSQCLWWHQEGPAACLRCPGVVTNNSRSKAMRDDLNR